MRFSIWSAVSSEKQTDNASLSEQETKCRLVGTSKTWVETSGPYIVPGESRTRWVNLRDAENEIPALNAMLEDAKAGRFDVLIMYDYNRLRDLLDAVAKTLASYSVQIFSVNQAVEPLAPEEFNPYASDSESMMRGLSQIISRWQISDLKRKYVYGVRARVRKGLHSIRLPYGYRRPPGREGDKTAAAVPVPAQAKIVVQIKDMFLAGKRYIEIARSLNEAGLVTSTGKQWEKTYIKQILINPFYAGKVFFGRTRTIHDPHHNKTRLIKNPNPQIEDGKHQALFTWDEHLEILSEVKRREGLPRHNRYAFSGLLECSVCHGRLIHDISYRAPVWHCQGETQHTLITAEEALALIPRALQKALQDVDPGGPLPSLPLPATAIADLERQKKRIQQAFESEIYTLEEADQKIKVINNEIKSYQSETDQRSRQQAERKRFTHTLAEARELLQHLPQWMANENPLVVNGVLTRLCQKITITPAGEIAIHFQQ